MPPKDVPPWSTNDAGQMHYMERNRRIQAWRKAACDAAREANIPGGRPLAPSFVRCTIPFWTRAAQRDPSNYVGTCHKGIVDGLVDAGLWPDDGPEWVVSIEPILEIMPKNDRWVTVTISPRSGGLHL
jgi:hypothetical protein